METMDDKKTGSAAEIVRQIEACKKNLNQGNLFSSLTSFRDLLDAFVNAHDVSKNEKNRLAAAINNFQRQLTLSTFFRDIYGKVQFRDDDFSTSYDFLCQLIEIKEDEISDVLISEDIRQRLNLGDFNTDDQQILKSMISLTERGESSALRELVLANDDLGSMVLLFYNEAGISSRKSGNIDKAILEYKKALAVSPDDENLYYNLARAYMEIDQKKNAKAAIERALQLKPDFPEGKQMLRHINQYPG